MPVEIKVPSFGESISEGVLARWIKKDGELVRRDEPVAELESEKATTEVRSPASGRVKATIGEGTTVPVGSVIGSIDESIAVPETTTRVPGVEALGHPSPGASKTQPQPPKQEKQLQPVLTAGMSPSARVHAESRGIDPGQLTGTGRGGRITKEDVLVGPNTNGHGQTPPVATSGHSGPRENRQRMSALRQRIAARLLESQQTTASLTTFNEADMSGIMRMRSEFKDKFEKKHGVKLGFMSFFVKAAVEALRAFPAVNARIDGSDIVYQNFYNVGVAVSTEKGLIVPVLKDADMLSFAAIEKEIGALAIKARDGKLATTDLQGGTFTVTNGGVFGSMMSTPILNPPQSGILGMHATINRPIAVGDQAVIRPMMYLALTYDHRIIDGREAVQFLVRVKECVEHPERLLLEV
ncbi:MAG: 2-oxoglutarate dehydrogenase complex dihydrolipoyllysine-residue succinyltransferase [Gemmataceae bacterium]